MASFDWSVSRHGFIEFVLVDHITKEEKEHLGYANGGSISYNLNTALKVSGSFRLDGIDDIGDDLIRIYVDAKDAHGTQIRYPLATLYAATPKRTLTSSRISSEVEGYSTLLRLEDERYKESLTIAKHTPIMQMVESLVTSSNMELIHNETNAQTQTQLKFDAGTSKLEVINELLSIAGFASLRVNGYGDALALRQNDPEKAPISHTFKDDGASILYSNIGHEKDWYSTPNVVICTSTSQDSLLVSVPARNDDPNDAYSTVSRGREIVRVEEYSDISSQETLNAKAELLLRTSSTRLEALEIEHGYIPIIPGDVVAIDIQSANLKGTYTVQTMEVHLSQALKTSTRLRRFV